MPKNSVDYDRSRMMDETSWWDLWNSAYRTKDSNDPVSSELFEHVSAVINKITERKPSCLLEVACGAGTVSRLLSCSTYHGLDISPAAIDIARRKSEDISRPPGVSPPTYEAADFHDWPLPPTPFDIVVCVDAISCFRDQQLVLSKIGQSLRTGGRIVLTTINPFVYERIKRSWENGPVSHWLSRRELHRLITSAGLTIERSYTIMPRGNLGILRIVNSWRLNEMLGPRVAAALRRLKEQLGLGQYRVVVARKQG